MVEQQQSKHTDALSHYRILKGDEQPPGYIQIRDTAIRRIVGGQVKPGDFLPTVRDLSEHLGSNPNTVQRAYRDLKLMGLVESQAGIGVRVLALNSRSRANAERELRAKVHRAIREAVEGGVSLDVNELLEAIGSCKKK